MCFIVIQKYSSKLESVTQKLQAVELDLFGTQSAIKDHLATIRADRNNCDEKNQIYRANPQIKDPEHYFKVTVYIP